MPRYTPDMIPTTGPVRVFCDGEEMSDVFEADDELGFAVVGVRKDGKLQLNGAKNAVEKRLITGVISVGFGKPEIK